MPLNKEVFITPEDKVRAFDLYKEKKGLRAPLYANTVFDNIRYFIAWMESEVGEEFAEEAAYYQKRGMLMNMEDRKRYEIIDDWDRRHPLIHHSFNPRWAEAVGCEVKKLELDVPIAAYGGYWELFYANYQNRVREIRLVAALKANTLREFLALDEKAVRQAAQGCKCGEKTISRVLAMKADLASLVKEFGLS